jgi:release factor glutamine methyltransferase
MTIAQALKFATAKLNNKKIKIPHLEAEILLSEILKKTREFLLAHGEKKITTGQISKLKLQISQRLKGRPVAYLTGHKEFYGLDFKVNKDVLIPRPETELMIEETLKIITHISQPMTITDIGTGSGCIIITLAKLLNKESKTANYKLWGIDISKKALIVAGQNAKTHLVAKNIKFKRGNLLEPILKNNKSAVSRQPVIILANLPYVWKKWKNNTSVDSIGLKFEPKIALYTGKNGLELYEKLFKQMKKIRIAGYALCEIDPRQTAEIKQLIKRELPQSKLQIKKDLSGLNRLAIIKISKKA